MNGETIITGMGFILPVGDTFEDFCGALTENKAEKHTVSDFDIKKYIDRKGMRTIDTNTKYALAACELALKDSGFEITDENRACCAVVMGTAFGGIESITGFDIVSRTRGFHALMPMNIVNTVMNAPAGQIAIIYGIRGVNATLSTGDGSSADGIVYCLDAMRTNNLKMALVGGVEQYCGVYRDYFKACGRETENLSDGALTFVFENEDSAKERNARVYGKIVGYSRMFTDDVSKDDLEYLTEKTLKESGVSRDEVDLIITNRQSVFESDKCIDISSVIGECYSVTGALLTAAALGVLNGKIKDKSADTVMTLLVGTDANSVCMLIKRGEV